MDKRLKLTRKQKGLVDRLRKLFDELKKENVGVLAEYDDFSFDGLIFYNASEVYDRDVFDCYNDDAEITENYRDYSVNYDADEDTVWYTPDPGDVERLILHHYIDSPVCGDNWFSVLLYKDEKADEFIQRKAKQEKLAPLLEKKDKLEKKIEEYENAIISGEDGLKRLEEKNVAPEIIEEEKTQITINKTRISELQKEISELNKDIRKVKAIRIKKPKK